MTTSSGKTKPRGKVRFDLEEEGRSLAVHLDRPGFRRLLATLERLAETGERQMFDRSGRRPAGSNDTVAELVFHIEGK